MVLLFVLLGLLALVCFAGLLYIAACASVMLISLLYNVFMLVTGKMTREQLSQKVESYKKQQAMKKRSNVSKSRYIVNVTVNCDDGYDETPYYS